MELDGIRNKSLPSHILMQVQYNVHCTLHSIHYINNNVCTLHSIHYINNNVCTLRFNYFPKPFRKSLKENISVR